MLGGGHFEHVSDAQQSLPRVSVRYHLEDGEVLQYAIHHISLGEMLQLPRNENIGL